MENPLHVLIISDIHCKYRREKEKLNTRMYSNMMKMPSNQNPFEALKQILDKDELKVDLILCPGDIADRIDEQGLITGWSYLEDLKRHLGLDHLVATVGNHDVDSRKINSEESFKAVRTFSHTYPIDDEELKTKFWANNYFILEEDEFILLVFNSSFSHDDAEKAEKSKIDDITLEKMRKDLENYDDTKIKIAMCHHHPDKHSNKDYPDGDCLEKGDWFLELLNENNFNLFVHGHKHDPRLNYMKSIPVLCAGSFSSFENVQELGAQNVFHHITICSERKWGVVQSYVYGPINGWKFKHDAYFPCKTGYGFTSPIDELAQKINDWMDGEELKFFEQLIIDIQEVNFLIPEDQVKLQKRLENHHSLMFMPKLPNVPYTISKQVK